ncbi:hypothetical protein [Klenkia sp. PcliD-1-E]|uniref:hypothetical protein n=1 Tax=Klenkia sp. PcliD-1-E TaxID=2954492 RepID=UPI002096CF41|nr:hypothetical protein [Klenkia sp. PcliD-1-E]MCO7220091.1 hypothetical protein [Klenkia sp. PcliD-1-E]
MPADAAILLDGYDGTWWNAGGRVIEALTGPCRQHGDLDIGVPRTDVAGLWRHLAGRFDVWVVDQGSLRPVLRADDDMPPSCVNLWLRRSGADPWEFDVLLSEVTDGTWSYQRDPRVSAALDDVLTEHGGVRYLRPEVQVLHEAPGLRPVDQAEAEASVPLLSTAARRRLRDALGVAHPGHPWIGAFARG